VRNWLIAIWLNRSCCREEVAITTVTHFNLIHSACHKEAVKADKKLKPPKTEWEVITRFLGCILNSLGLTGRGHSQFAHSVQQSLPHLGLLDRPSHLHTARPDLLVCHASLRCNNSRSCRVQGPNSWPRRIPAAGLRAAHRGSSHAALAVYLCLSCPALITSAVTRTRNPSRPSARVAAAKGVAAVHLHRHSLCLVGSNMKFVPYMVQMGVHLFISGLAGTPANP